MFDSSALTGCTHQILGEKQSALAGANKIRVAVAIHVAHRNLHSAAHAGTVVDEVADPLLRSLFRLPVFIPVNTEWLPLSRVVAVVRHVSLSGNQIQLAIAVEIRERGGVRLRP